jgi:hypothetical protein
MGHNQSALSYSTLLSIFYEHPPQPEHEPEQLFPDEEPEDCKSSCEDELPDLIGVNTLIMLAPPQFSHFISSELSFFT